MAAGQYNFAIEQGVTVKKQFTYKDSSGNPVNLGTHYQARMQIRSTIDSPVKIGDFSTSASNGLSIINTTGSSPAVSGTIELLIPATSTSLYNFDTAVYDLEIEQTATNTVTRLLQGRIKLSKEVTR